MQYKVSFRTNEMAFTLSSAVVYWLFTGMLLVAVSDGSSFQINKCCPRNHRLDSELNCIQTRAKIVEDFSWFPIDAIVDSKTLKIHQHEKEKYIDMLRKKYTVNYGFIPECEQSDSRQFSFHKSKVVEWFNYIIHENGKMEVHVTKPSSFHDPSESILSFHKINNESEAMPIYHHYDSLRTLPLEDSCTDLGDDSMHILYYCPCRTLLCLRKCCADHQHLAIESISCVDSLDVFPEPAFAKWRPKMEGVIDNYYLLSDTFPSCERPLLLKSEHSIYSSCNRYRKASDNDFTILPNGNLKVRKYKTLLNASQYCGEVTVFENGTIEEENLVYCQPKKVQMEESYKLIKHTLYGVLQIIGGVCLLLTVVISLYLPNLRRQVHNKIALSHNASLMVANFAWSVLQLFNGLGPKTCIFVALLMQFTFLASFFWLNVMCIDISLTFSSNRHMKSGRFDGGAKKFMYYCVYAWGSTTFITIITMLMEFLPDLGPDYLKPGFGCICGFNNENLSMAIYLYGPMTILLLVNFVLFVYTTIRILNIQKQTSVLHKTDSNTTGGSSFQTDKQRYDLNQWLILYGKLFLLMGITWIMEVVSWSIGGPTYYWYFSDMLNLLRAVFIFILFICKKQVFWSIRKKLNGEMQTGSEKTNSGKSQTDVIAFNSTPPDRPRGSIVSNKSKGSIRSLDFPRSARFKPNTNPSPIKESSM